MARKMAGNEATWLWRPARCDMYKTIPRIVEFSRQAVNVSQWVGDSLKKNKDQHMPVIPFLGSSVND